MIHVCYVVDAPYAGGAERYVALLAESLDRRRFVPSVVARSGAGLDAWCAGLRDHDITVSRVPMNLPFRPGTWGASFAHCGVSARTSCT